MLADSAYGATIKVCDEIMNPPTRSEISDVIHLLLSGDLTRNGASEWADAWLLNDVPVKDSVVWDAIKLLGAANLISTDRPFLYNEMDFEMALKKLASESLS